MSTFYLTSQIHHWICVVFQIYDSSILQFVMIKNYFWIHSRIPYTRHVPIETIIIIMIITQDNEIFVQTRQQSEKIEFKRCTYVKRSNRKTVNYIRAAREVYVKVTLDGSATETININVYMCIPITYPAKTRRYEIRSISRTNRLVYYIYIVTRMYIVDV